MNYYRLPREYEIGLKFKYMSGLPYTAVVWDNDLTIGPYNAERYAPYLRFDLRITKSFSMLGHKGHWYTEFWNMFNTPNAFLRDQRTGNIKSIGTDLYIPMLFTGFDFKW